MGRCIVEEFDVRNPHKILAFSAYKVSHSSNNSCVPLKQIYIDRTKINIKTDDYLEDKVATKLISPEKSFCEDSPMEQSGKALLL